MGDRKKLLVQQLGLPLISLRVPKHSVASRMHGLTAIDLINRRDTAPIDFPSSSLIAINRDSRTRTFHRGRSEFPENVRNSLQDKGVGSPGRIRTSNISVNSRGCETLNALFGVAYDREHLESRPSVGQLWATN